MVRKKDFARLLRTVLTVVWTPRLEPRLERPNLRRLIVIEVEIENSNLQMEMRRARTRHIVHRKPAAAQLTHRQRLHPCLATGPFPPQSRPTQTHHAFFTLWAEMRLQETHFLAVRAAGGARGISTSNAERLAARPPSHHSGGL